MKWMKSKWSREIRFPLPLGEGKGEGLSDRKPFPSFPFPKGKGMEKRQTRIKYEWDLAKPQRLKRPIKPKNHPQPAWFYPF